MNPGDKLNGSMSKGKHVRFNVPFNDSISVRLCVEKGEFVIYASVYMSPSEAFYDWKIPVETECRSVHLHPNISGRNHSERQTELRITIEGQSEGANSFFILSSDSKPG